MHFRKIISLWALLALVFAQFAIAGHSAVHADHGFEMAQAQQPLVHDHDDQKPARSHECPECVLVKSLQTAFYSSTAIAANFVWQKQAFSLPEFFYVSQAAANAYNPRAPPAFLI